MFNVEQYKGNKQENYLLAEKQLIALVEGEPNRIANLSNACALLNQLLDEVNWVGFYLSENDGLVLGPFQGLPACIRIPFGKGVCGSAAAERRTIRAEDVQQFPGHIACDAASRSEIVIPLIKGDELIGVLDIDSPITHRFDTIDEEMLEKFVHTLVKNL